MLPPGTGTGAGRPLRAEALAAGGAHAGGRGGAARAARGWARASGPRSRRSPAAPLGAAALGAPRPAATTRRCAASSGAAWSGSRTRAERARAGRACSGRGARAGACRAHRRPGGRLRRDRGAASGARRAPLLLHGVTGSGKTEVYLRAVAAALERGRSAIVLVPEIALTPQTAGRFVERFGDAVAVMHSRLSPRERYDEWWRMRRGEARVCVGPRSAVFAPFDDLGLIVVDEEHDGSYKQEGDPRYDARAVAERRAADGGRAARGGQRHPAAGEHARATSGSALPARVDGREPAAGRARRRCRARPGRSTSARARRSTRCARRGEKAIVLLNRRGWSNFLSCRVVRARVGVPALRRDARAPPRGAARWPATTAATASRCRARAPTAARCRWPATGPGTEQLERELEALVAPLPVFRLDSDVAAAAGVAAVLRRFDAGARRRARRHADGGEGPRLPRRHARASCSTPTRRCASPTSAPRSAPSRSWPSSPGAAAAARAAAA